MHVSVYNEYVLHILYTVLLIQTIARNDAYIIVHVAYMQIHYICVCIYRCTYVVYVCANDCI